MPYPRITPHVELSTPHRSPMPAPVRDGACHERIRWTSSSRKRASFINATKNVPTLVSGKLSAGPLAYSRSASLCKTDVLTWRPAPAPSTPAFSNDALALIETSDRPTKWTVLVAFPRLAFVLFLRRYVARNSMANKAVCGNTGSMALRRGSHKHANRHQPKAVRAGKLITHSS
jgi:hypothetical protein